MDNVEVVRQLEAAYNARDYDTVRRLVAPGIQCHTPGSQMMPPGVEGCIAANEGGYTTFPDKRSELLSAFGEGDKVVAHVRMTGTNRGGLQWAGIPANDRPVDTEWIQISRHAPDGRIVETWAQMDIARMLVQLGAMPAPEGM